MDDLAAKLIAALAEHNGVVLPAVRDVAADAWDEGYTIGNRHDGRRDANPYRDSDPS